MEKGEETRYRKGLPLPEISPELSKIIAKSPWNLSVIPIDEAERYDRTAAIRSLAVLELFVSKKKLAEVAVFIKAFSEITSKNEAAALLTEITDAFAGNPPTDDPDHLIGELLRKAVSHLS